MSPVRDSRKHNSESAVLLVRGQRVHSPGHGVANLAFGVHSLLSSLENLFADVARDTDNAVNVTNGDIAGSDLNVTNPNWHAPFREALAGWRVRGRPIACENGELSIKDLAHVADTAVDDSTATPLCDQRRRGQFA